MLLLSRIDDLLEQIEAQRKLLDRSLFRPARWRGPLRRELSGRPDPEARARVAAAFDAGVRAPRQAPIFDAALLKTLHDEAAGGAEFRATGARIRYGRDYSPLRPPAPAAVPDLVKRALERATDGVEPPPLAAARLHLELLLIHPFSDGNGRAVRLLCAHLLARAGFRSTLFTAVEQHFAETPWKYGQAFIDLGERGGDDHWIWIATALEAMAAHSRLVFLHRAGEWKPEDRDEKEVRDFVAQRARIAAEEADGARAIGEQTAALPA